MPGVKKLRLAVVLLILIGSVLPLFSYLNIAQSPTEVPQFHESSASEQVALVGAVLVAKPLYMLLSLLFIVVLWRLKSPDTVALRRGLVFFLVGETFCGLNIVLNHSYYLFELFHMYGMVVGFAFIAYAFIEGMDARVLGYSDPARRCALAGVCRECVKSGRGVCGLRRMFYFVIPAGVILALIPLLSAIHAVSYNTRILGLSYDLSHPAIYQIFELRYAPAYAIVLFIASFLVFHFLKDRVAVFRVLFAAGTGALGFAFLRLFFFGVNPENLAWAESWEEFTELMFVAGTGFVLWAFRRGLVPAKEN